MPPKQKIASTSGVRTAAQPSASPGPAPQASRERRIATTAAMLEVASNTIFDIRPLEIAGQKVPGPAIRALSPLDRARFVYSARPEAARITLARALVKLDPAVQPVPGPGDLLPQPYVLRHTATRNEVRRQISSRRSTP